MTYFKAPKTKREKKRAEDRKTDKLLQKRLTPEMCERLETGVVDALAEHKFQQRWSRLYEVFYLILRKHKISDNRCKEILNAIAEALGDKIEITEVKE